jgi:hypothetical protein
MEIKKGDTNRCVSLLFICFRLSVYNDFRGLLTSFYTVVDNFPVYGFHGLIRGLFGFLVDFQEIQSGTPVIVSRAEPLHDDTILFPAEYFALYFAERGGGILLEVDYVTVYVDGVIAGVNGAAVASVIGHVFPFGVP